MAKPIWDEVLAEVARASERTQPPFRVIVNEQAAAILEAAGWVRDRDFLVSESVPARVVFPVADLGDWTPRYGPDDRAESALDDPDTASLQFRMAPARPGDIEL